MSKEIIKAEDAVQNTNYLQEIFNDINKNFPEELELAQGRSNFQIEKFIAVNNFTLSSCYKHCLKNASVMRKELFRVIKEGIEKQREFELKWNNKDVTKPIEWKTPEGGIKNCWFDLDEFEYKVYMNDLAISIKDKVQQLSFFDEILSALVEKNGGPITKEQFDNEEPEYWNRRLSKQISDELISRTTGIHTGNIDSMRNAAAPTIIEGSKNFITNVPSFDTLVDKSGAFDPTKFIVHANQGLMDNYLEISSGFEKHVKQQLLNQRENVEKIEEKVVNNQEVIKDADSFLQSLGISSTTKK